MFPRTREAPDITEDAKKERKKRKNTIANHSWKMLGVHWGEEEYQTRGRGDEDGVRDEVRTGMPVLSWGTK